MDPYEEIPFPKVHQRFEELMGRAVYTHEMTGTERFAAELRRGRPANIAEIMDKVPAGKLVTVGLEGSSKGAPS